MKLKNQLDKIYKKLYRKVWHQRILKNRIDLPRSQSIFTVYDLFPVNGVEVVRNQQPQLSKALQEKPRIKQLVHFLGAPFVERDGMNEAMYFSWLQQIRAEYEQSVHFVYLLHPRQSDGFGARLKKALDIEVTRFGLPYELELMRMEQVPAVVASWFCTALDNLAVAQPDGVRLVSYRLPAFEDMKLKPNQRPIFESAREFYRRHDEGSQVEVREIPYAVSTTLEEVAQSLPKADTSELLITLKLNTGGNDQEASTLVGFHESIGSALKRLWALKHADNLTIPSVLQTFITDAVLPIRLDHFGHTSQRLALTFNFLSPSLQQELRGASIPATVCTFSCQKTYLPDSLVDEIVITKGQMPAISKAIRLMLVVSDTEGQLLVTQRKEQPGRGQLEFPSIRVSDGRTLDTAFGTLTTWLFGVQMLRAQAEELLWFEQVEPPRFEGGENLPSEYTLNLVYKLQVPSQHFVHETSSSELKNPSWWKLDVFRACPLISRAALRIVNLEINK